MTSSLRNSLHRRNHKERGQIARRKKFGLLEKHKDYVARARDYHSKQDRLSALRQKAADRNKDEFYFGMVNTKTKRGVHTKDRGNSSLPTDVVKVLKTQDENYIRTMKSTNLKKIDRLKVRLSTEAGLDTKTLDPEEITILRDAGLLAGPSKTTRTPTRHTVFMSSKAEAQQYVGQREEEEFATESESDNEEASAQQSLGWIQKPARKLSTKGKRPITEATEEQELDGNPATSLLKELRARLKRDTQLGFTRREFEMQRLLMGKGTRKKVSGVTLIKDPDEAGDREDEDEFYLPKKQRTKRTAVDERTWTPRVYKWKFERKR